MGNRERGTGNGEGYPSPAVHRVGQQPFAPPLLTATPPRRRQLPSVVEPDDMEILPLPDAEPEGAVKAQVATGEGPHRCAVHREPDAVRHDIDRQGDPLRRGDRVGRQAVKPEVGRHGMVLRAVAVNHGGGPVPPNQYPEPLHIGERPVEAQAAHEQANRLVTGIRKEEELRLDSEVARRRHPRVEQQRPGPRGDMPAGRHRHEVVPRPGVRLDPRGHVLPRRIGDGPPARGHPLDLGGGGHGEQDGGSSEGQGAHQGSPRLE